MELRLSCTNPSSSWYTSFVQMDGLVQEKRNSSALTLELRLSCTDPSSSWYTSFVQINGLVQERLNSSALAMELRLSCTNPSSSWYISFVQISGLANALELRLSCTNPSRCSTMHEIKRVPRKTTKFQLHEVLQWSVPQSCSSFDAVAPYSTESHHLMPWPPIALSPIIWCRGPL